jgi:integrase
MSSIKKTTAGEWRARWRTPEGASRSKTFDRKVDAEQWLTHTEHKKLSGEYVDPSDGRVHFDDYAASWLESQVWRPSTAVHVQAIVKHHLAPALGSRPLSSVTPSVVQTLVKQLSTSLAPGTVRGVYTVLCAIYRAAVRDRLVTSSPCVSIKLPRVEVRRVEPLSVEGVEAVADAVGIKCRPLVILGAGAGLRVGEALGLRVDSIDFLRRQLTVTQQAVTVRRVPTLGPPKTSAPVRTVPLADFVVGELAEYVKHHPPGPLGLLVADDPIPQNRFSQTWARSLAKAGLPVGTRYHDLRQHVRFRAHQRGLLSQECADRTRSRKRRDHFERLQPSVA